MGEPNRKDDQLTTADFANRAAARKSAAQSTPREEHQKAAVERPRLVQTEQDRTDNLGSASPEPSGTTPLLSESEIGDMRSRWSNIQAGFVDEPRQSVEQADQLVATAMQKLAEGFAKERETLEKQWDSGDNVSTEELRVALQRYRSFFGRLLNAA